MSGDGDRRRLPAWARGVLALSPRRDRHADIAADLAELFADRTIRYGHVYAHRRLARDLVSLWRGSLRGGRMLQDLRFALRLMRRSPAPVAICVAGLALAIAVATTAFTLVNASLLRRYGVTDPGSLVTVTELNAQHSSRPFPWMPYPQYLKMRAAAPGIRLEASTLEKVRINNRLTEDGGPSRFLLFTGGGYLELLGARPVLGRTLGPDDDVTGAAPAVVVSHHLWSTDLGGDPGVIGGTIWLNNVPATLVGVLDRGFSAPGSIRPAAWAPLSIASQITGGTPYTSERGGLVDVIGRLAPGTSIRAAEDQLTALLATMRPAANDAERPSRQARLFTAATPLDGPDAGESYLALACLFAGVALIVGLACANTANLLLAAATTRAREIGVRLALGATRRRLIAQLVTESAMLGVIGGGLGYLIALALSPVIAGVVGLSPEIDLRPDTRVLMFTIAAALASGIGAGLTPARFGARGDVLAAIRADGTRRGSARRPSRLRTSFVAFQAAVSMLLVAGAALLMRTTLVMTGADLGFDADRTLSVYLGGPRAEVNTDAYLARVVDAVRQVPGVQRVSVAQYVPFGGAVWTDEFSAGGRTYEIFKHPADAAFVETLGLRITRGRAFTPEEIASAAPVAIISENLVRDFFGEADPIGLSLSRIPSEGRSGFQPHATIVGVVAEAMLSHLHSEAYGAILVPLERTRSNPPGLVVRTAAPGLTAMQIETALRRLDARLQPNIRIVREGLDVFFDNKRMMAWLAGPLAALSFVLAVVGVFGVTAFVVNQRQHEVSVRLAIGASAADVRRLLVTDSLRPVLAGLATGLAGALALSRLFASLLAGISPYDPLSIAIATTTLLAGAVAAVNGPARRASRVDPAAVLK